MATKPNLAGVKGAKMFNKILLKNGFEITKIKGSHVTFRRGSDVIVMNSNNHEIRNELAWHLINMYNLEWRDYI